MEIITGFFPRNTIRPQSNADAFHPIWQSACSRMAVPASRQRPTKRAPLTGNQLYGMGLHKLMGTAKYPRKPHHDDHR
jgi:hypothetical protein